MGEVKVRDEEFLDTLQIQPAPNGFKAVGFDCGEPELTDYICDGTSAGDESAGVSRSYLVHEPGGELVGYFTVLADSIRLASGERPRELTYPSAPAIKLGRMGVHLNYRGRGLGRWILDNVVGLAAEIGEQVGVRYVTLDALQRPRLIDMYADYGFKRNKEERKLAAVRLKLPSWRDLHMVSMRYDIRL